MQDATLKTAEAAFAAIAEHTREKCGACLAPYACCTAEQCAATISFAKETYGVELVTTDHPKLPLMGPAGCTAAPHFRPICAVHVCEQHLIGETPWTDAYWDLRMQAEDAFERVLEETPRS
jgi:hypothetical protein